MLPILIAALLQAAAPAAQEVVLIANPEWDAQPTPAEIARAYPGSTGLVSAGSATLLCQVTAAGFPHGCQIESEQPGYVGFGAAAMRLSSRYKVKMTHEDGAPVTGGAVLITVEFPRRGR